MAARLAALSVSNASGAHAACEELVSAFEDGLDCHKPEVRRGVVDMLLLLDSPAGELEEAEESARATAGLKAHRGEALSVVCSYEALRVRVTAAGMQARCVVCGKLKM
jgi:hypothetical protein